MGRRFRYVLSAAFAVLAALLCAAYGQSIRDEAAAERAEVLARFGGEVVTIAVASQALEVGDVASAENVVLQDWASDLVPEGAYTSAEELYGLTVGVPASAGVPLTALNFRDADGDVDVPSGKIALSIQVTDKLGLPSSAGAGTTLAAYEVTDDGVSLLSASLTVLRNSTGTGTVGSKGTVTLACGPDEVPRVLSASAEGSLRLAQPADDVEALGDAAAEAPSTVLSQTDGAAADADEDGGDAAAGDGDADAAPAGGDAAATEGEDEGGGVDGNAAASAGQASADGSLTAGDAL